MRSLSVGGAGGGVALAPAHSRQLPTVAVRPPEPCRWADPDRRPLLFHVRQFSGDDYV